MMNDQPRIPPALQDAIHIAVEHLDTRPRDAVDAEDILRVLAIFQHEGSAGTTMTVAQQRLLLLGCLTFRQLLPLWQHRHPHDLRATRFLQQAVDTILQRAGAQPHVPALDLLWEHTEALQPCDPRQEPITRSAYTLTKAIDHAVNAHSLYRDYHLETHVGVALCLMARAYSDHGPHHDDDTPAHDSAFWRCWFTAIVPHAWPTSRTKP